MEKDEQIKQLQAQLDAAQENNAALQAQLDELQKEKAAVDTKLADAETQKDGEAQKAEAARKELIEYKVEALVKAGRIAAAGKDAMISAAMAAPDNGAALLSAIPEKASASIPPVQAPAQGAAPQLSGVALAAKGFNAMMK